VALADDAFVAVTCHSAGIEILDSLHTASLELLDRWEADETQDALPEDAQGVHINFVQGDLTKVTDWTEADVLFLNSTCFDEELMRAIAAASADMKVGSFAISFTKRLPSEKWSVRGLRIRNRKTTSTSGSPFAGACCSCAEERPPCDGSGCTPAPESGTWRSHPPPHAPALSRDFLPHTCRYLRALWSRCRGAAPPYSFTRRCSRSATRCTAMPCDAT
jgi:hypothetical protein